MPSPDVTENSIRLRQKDPDLFVQDSFRTIDISKEQGIQAVVGKLKSDPDGAMVVQTYIFDKEKWTSSEAEKWVSEHNKRSGMEKRTANANFRFTVENKVSRLAGTAIPYNALSENSIPGWGNVKERILPGAFAKSIASRDIFMLSQHKIEHVFGRTSKGTLRLKEEDDGVKFENDVPETQWAKDDFLSIKRGDISNMSFSFTDKVVTWTREGKEDVRNVREADLFEISVVTFPVYQSSSVYARSGDLMIVDGNLILDYTPPEKIVEIEKAKDERFQELMNQFESLKKQWD